jgi:DNA-binding transcriptional MerR regulator
MENELLFASGAARILELSRAGVVYHAKHGNLASIRAANGTRIFRREDVERFKIERQSKERAEACAAK